MIALYIILTISHNPTYSFNINPEFDRQVIASWYALDGQIMANGEIFNQDNPFLAAHKSLPFGSRVLVYNPSNEKGLVVTITDRGPFVKNRHLDLSKAAAEILDFIEVGVAKLMMRVIYQPES